MSKLRILLADDHTLIREGLKALINAQPDMEVIGEAGDGLAAYKVAKELQPDLVVMDVSMPEMNGSKSTERIKQEFPGVKVLALTVHEDKGYLRQLIQAGASGYVLKRAAAEDLIHAIRAIVSGGVYVDPAMMSKVVGNSTRLRSLDEALKDNNLSERETEVLRLIALGYSNKEIAAQLEISIKTVETYKSRLMEKLDLHSRVDIVRYALRQGLMQDN
ncbi:MAG TPA: response regulator transcription factor [Pyrinomonadaceae bacterium]|nr:response regulator transcription factor [Pyrinomonadaceae bacterium]